MSAKRLVITGRVQGVGYRHRLTQQAHRLGLDGWVRNRPDGAVEALLSGNTAGVEELARLCRRGPRFASVTGITEELAEPPSEPGFQRLG